MFPHCTASATKLRPQTGPENRSGKRPALLLRTANENGGPDNITALLLCVEEVR